MDLLSCLSSFHPSFFPFSLVCPALSPCSSVNFQIKNLPSSPLVDALASLPSSLSVLHNLDSICHVCAVISHIPQAQIWPTSFQSIAFKSNNSLSFLVSINLLLIVGIQTVESCNRPNRGQRSPRGSHFLPDCCHGSDELEKPRVLVDDQRHLLLFQKFES